MGRQKPAEGDIFLVELDDSTYSIGQVMKVTKEVLNSVLCAFFYTRVSDKGASFDLPTESNLLSVQFVTPELLSNGKWVIVKNVAPIIDYERFVPYKELAQKKFVGAKIRGAGILVHFLNACFGLRPWDSWREPDYFDHLLVSPDRRPTTIRFDQ